MTGRKNFYILILTTSDWVLKCRDSLTSGAIHLTRFLFLPSSPRYCSGLNNSLVRPYSDTCTFFWSVTLKHIESSNKLFARWLIFHAFVVIGWLFSKLTFSKSLSGTLSECWTVGIQIMLALIWVQTVWKGYQQMTKVVASKKIILNKRALEPWIIHLNPGTWDDGLGLWLKRYHFKIFLFSALVSRA